LEEPEQATISYADFALQLETVGVPAPTSMEDEGFSEWRLAVLGLRAPRLPIEFPDEFRADFGFDLLQAEQTLEISNLPFNLTLYRGGFDQDAITASLQELGYRPVAIEGATVFGVREDFESDLGGPMGYAGSFLNYAAFLEDGTLALAPARSIIAAVVAVDAGEAPSLAEDRNVAALLDAAPTDLASALLVPGAQLGGGLPPDASVFDPNATPDVDAIETTTAQQAQLPPISLALLGLTPGGPLGQIDLLDEDSPQLAPDAPRAGVHRPRAGRSGGSRRRRADHRGATGNRRVRFPRGAVRRSLSRS
jgi:hypothetical protein